MKRIIHILLAAASLLLCSCQLSDDPVMFVDWYPVNVILMMQDAEGNDLLDPARPDNLIEGTSITFRGQTYEASCELYEKYRSIPETRVYAAFMYGLQLRQNSQLWEDGTGYSLVFGEIDGALDMDEDMVVTWANGMQATIHYHCSDHNERKLDCKRSWTLDGDTVDSSIFTFVAE